MWAAEGGRPWVAVGWEVFQRLVGRCPGGRLVERVTTHTQECMCGTTAVTWPQGLAHLYLVSAIVFFNSSAQFNILTRLHTPHTVKSISLCRFQHPRRRRRSHSQLASNSSGLTMCLRPSGRLTSLRSRSNGHTFEARPGISSWLMPSLSKHQPRGTPSPERYTNSPVC